MELIEGRAQSLGDMSMAELLGVAGLSILWLAFVGFWIWFVWKIIRAQLRMPDELAGIRKALERIADKIERT